MYVLTAVLLLTQDAPAARSPIPFHNEATVVFATVEQGQEALGKSDVFSRAMSPFDRQSRMQTTTKLDEPAYLKFARSHVLAWEPEEIVKLEKAIRSLSGRLEPFDLPLPKQILLVKTTGKDEVGAAYCRANAIVLPASKLKREDTRLERLLAHELFHVLSNQNPELRDELYEIIGFHRCNPVELPKGYSDRRITNPDAPVIEHYITLQIDDEEVPAVPMLYSSAPRFQEGQGGFFKVMEFKLFEIEEIDGTWKVKIRNDEPRLFDPFITESYLKQIGDNTDYIIHPDEILAENFVSLVTREEELNSPQIVEGMEQLLRRRATGDAVESTAADGKEPLNERDAAPPAKDPR